MLPRFWPTSGFVEILGGHSISTSPVADDAQSAVGAVVCVTKGFVRKACNYAFGLPTDDF